MIRERVRMFVALCACCIFVVRTNVMLYPVVTYHEALGHEGYVNVSIIDIGEHITNRTYLLHFESLREIRDMKTFFSYSIRAFDGAVQQMLLSRWIDGCEFLRRPNSFRLLKMFYDAVKNNSKIPLCPYRPGYVMALNITPSNFPIPAFIPETDFLVEVKVYTRARTLLIIETRWYGSLLRMEN
ncbi:uncharacterized protein LOC128709203 [Anopheles marshallii]|uniref:uncharacterized protein LOC128709203 n=1 Tax=Anopheles marshallii TaxID=1521116 RepID=UPI00237BFB73|nr:uncharacterized protein LOC128709203 [Anopheles marshallii]